MNTETLACAIVGHLVGDYLLQNDWMALNKKRSMTICAIHCFIWANCVMIFAGWFTNHWAFTVLYCTHLVQDHSDIVKSWMSMIGQKQFMKCDDFDLTDMRVVPGLGPWSVIVVDNVWHILTIWVVWRFIA